MTPWLQSYDPLHQVAGSTLAAALPILFFIVTLAVLRWRLHWAAAGTLLLAAAVAVTVYGMPVASAVAAALYGFAYGLWPIVWIIGGVVFLYRLTVKSGQFEVVRASIASVTPDARLQMILIGFAFSAFLEGAAGYGTPVAITAALLVGLGFDPLRAATLCLIANTAPVAFGAMGTSITVAAQVSHADLAALTAIAGTLLPLFSLLTLGWVVVALAGWRGARDIWPALLVAGVSFSGTMMATALWIGPQLPAITAALVCMVSLVVLLRFWQPTKALHLREHTPIYPAMMETPPLTARRIATAWLPFGLLTMCVVLWGNKSFQSWFAPDGMLSETTRWLEVPFLHGVVYKTAPVVLGAELYPAVFRFDMLGAVGTGIFLATLLSAACLRWRPKFVLGVFRETCVSLWPTVLTIGLVLAFATLTNYAGMSATLALALAGSGKMYPLLAPTLGWFGVFLTGSDTASNALFAPLQATVAHQIGVSDTLLVAANMLGGAAGKMISLQSIAVACAAVGLMGREASMLRATLRASVVFAVLAGIVIFILT
ncbi:MAG: lactate permease LctP family transporter [Burkholderiales bacterium]|jgi:L-lactate transport|nr:lactate permease LctP family transporter [Burkholderiales bacterium]